MLQSTANPTATISSAEQTHIILARQASRLGAEPSLRRARDRGELHKLAQGAYVVADAWKRMSLDEQYRTRVRAFALLGPSDRQFSHDSAAAMLRLPSVGGWPRLIHVTARVESGGTKRAGIRWHGIGADVDSQVVGGVTVTSLARTAVDLACSSAFVRSVAAVDDALRTPREGDPRWGWGLPAPTKADLVHQLEARLPLRGSRLGFAVIDFADKDSGSPAESIYRVQFRALGFPPPVLQHPVFDAAGLIGYLDFWFPTLGLGLEIDGAAKYSSSRHYQRNLDPGTIFRLEKRREDRLRDVLPRFTRMDAALGFNRRAIAAHLTPFGLIPTRTSAA